MSERRTETTVNVYAGVPFNNKYKDVLFVSRETLTSYLSQFEIGQSVTSNRFEIIDETQAIIDLTNDFECMNANYCKVHRKIMPETNEDVYEYDSYYFVTRARQIATNVIRLYLELDVFQTQFNKYDYNVNMQEELPEKIPQIKNSIITMTTNKEELTKAGHFYSNVEKEMFNANITYSPFINTGNECSIIIKYIEEKGGMESVAFLTRTHTQGVSPDPQKVYRLFTNNKTQNNYFEFSEFVKTLTTSKKIYDELNNAFNIEILGIYFVPSFYLADVFSQIETNSYKVFVKDNASSTFYYILQSFSGLNFEHIIEKTLTPQPNTQMAVGTLENSILLEYNGNSYNVKLRICANNDFNIRLEANNKIIDVTNAFELSLLASEYGSYMQQNTNGFAIKNVSKAVLSLAGVASGNPLSLLTATQTLSEFATEYGKIADLKKQPPKIEVDASSGTGMALMRCIGVFENIPINQNDIDKSIKYYGYRLENLTSKNFYYQEDPIYEEIPGSNPPEYELTQHNFDYFQFSNVQVVGELPQTFQTQIEQMFLSGIRIWYNANKFLQTIENKEIVQE
jgi:hypothetical protein